MLLSQVLYSLALSIVPLLLPTAPPKPVLVCKLEAGVKRLGTEARQIGGEARRRLVRLISRVHTRPGDISCRRRHGRRRRLVNSTALHTDYDKIFGPSLQVNFLRARPRSMNSPNRPIYLYTPICSTDELIPASLATVPTSTWVLIEPDSMVNEPATATAPDEGVPPVGILMVFVLVVIFLFICAMGLLSFFQTRRLKETRVHFVPVEKDDEEEVMPFDLALAQVNLPTLPSQAPLPPPAVQMAGTTPIAANVVSPVMSHESSPTTPPRRRSRTNPTNRPTTRPSSSLGSSAASASVFGATASTTAGNLHLDALLCSPGDLHFLAANPTSAPPISSPPSQDVFGAPTASMVDISPSSSSSPSTSGEALSPALTIARQNLRERGSAIVSPPRPETTGSPSTPDGRPARLPPSPSPHTESLRPVTFSCSSASSARQNRRGSQSRSSPFRSAPTAIPSPSTPLPSASSVMSLGELGSPAQLVLPKRARSEVAEAWVAGRLSGSQDRTDAAESATVLEAEDVVDEVRQMLHAAERTPGLLLRLSQAQGPSVDEVEVSGDPQVAEFLRQIAQFCEGMIPTPAVRALVWEFLNQRVALHRSVIADAPPSVFNSTTGHAGMEEEEDVAEEEEAVRSVLAEIPPSLLNRTANRAGVEEEDEPKERVTQGADNARLTRLNMKEIVWAQ
ncbi:hypothetical protein C8R43DRAFT_1019073 [Mycena crocata]|nr:hypothetical protein C8R43DRAFT_1019073 [Mycena crocata]